MLIPKNKPYRSRRYLRRVASLPCVVCGVQPAGDAHHVIGTGEGGMGTKAPDDRSFPLCRLHHSELHDWGRITWETLYGSQDEHAKKTREFLG